MKIVIPAYLFKDKGSYYFILFFTISFLLSSNVSIAQANIIDSLKKVAVVCSIEEKSTKYLEVAEAYSYSSFDSAVHYAEIALDYAYRVDNTTQIVHSLMLVAKMNNNFGNYSLSINLLNKAKDISISESNYELLTNVYLGIAQIYNSKFDYYKVIGVLDSALITVDENNIYILKPDVLNYIGNLYLNINDIQSARYYANMASAALDEYNNPDANVRNLHLKAIISFKEHESASSLRLFNDALHASKQCKNKRLIQLSYRRLASYYIDIDSYDTAIIYIDSSLVLTQESGFVIEESTLLTYKAHIEWLKKDFESALNYNLKALAIRQKTGHIASICSSLLNIGGNYIELNKYNKAQNYLEKGLSIAEEQKILAFISRGYEKLSLLNKHKGNFKEALYYYELKSHYNDSVLLKRTNEKVIFFSNLYAIEKEKRLIESIKLSKKSNEFIFLIIGTILSLLIIIMLFRNNYVKNKSTKEIVKLSKVIETTEQAVVISNDKGKMLYVNKGLKNMLGFPKDEDLSNASIFQFTAKKDRQLLVNTVFPQLLNNKNWKGEIPLFKKDKTIIVAELTCSIIVGQHGEQDLFVAIFSNITNRKKNEIELKESRESLKKAVETQDKIFSIIAHDLTGPFNTILGFSEIMAVDYDKYKRDDHLRFSNIINESSKRTFDVLTNLLHWSRSQLGKISINKEKHRLYDIVEENLTLLKHMYNKKDIAIHNNIDPSFIIISDISTLSIVIRNLLSNAIKFTNRNGVIEISSSNDSENSIITITDNGVGIEPEDIEKLFDPSKSDSKPGTENEKGTGLGLMLCKELIEFNSGSISVKSTLGLGSSFIISLPRF